MANMYGDCLCRSDTQKELKPQKENCGYTYIKHLRLNYIMGRPVVRVPFGSMRLTGCVLTRGMCNSEHMSWLEPNQ